MLKILIIAFILPGCDGGGANYDPEITIVELFKPAIVAEPVVIPEPIEEPEITPVYLITGQSNAKKPDWEYVEDRTGIETVSIAMGASGIDVLIAEFNPESVVGNIVGIIFIHGERDARLLMPGDEYAAKVEEYRQMISIAANRDLELIISSVGQPVWEASGLEVPGFHDVRNAVRAEALINDKWSIFFDDAEKFGEWGMLEDPLHPNEDGLLILQDALVAYLNNNT